MQDFYLNLVNELHLVANYAAFENSHPILCPDNFILKVPIQYLFYKSKTNKLKQQ